jgi:hypothetical protein
MKAIDLATSRPTLQEVLDLAGEENVVLRTPEGRQFVLAEIDDFADEIARVRHNAELMGLLESRSREEGRLSMAQVRERLKGGKKSRSTRGTARKK